MFFPLMNFLLMWSKESAPAVVYHYALPIKSFESQAITRIPHHAVPIQAGITSCSFRTAVRNNAFNDRTSKMRIGMLNGFHSNDSWMSPRKRDTRLRTHPVVGHGTPNT